MRRADHCAAEQGAHGGGVIEVLRADGVVVAVAEERCATAPVLVAAPVVDRFGTLRRHERAGRQVGLQPGGPVGLHVLLHRLRQQLAEQVPDEQQVGDLPAHPVARRNGEQFLEPALVRARRVAPADLRPRADIVAADALQFADACDLPCRALLQGTTGSTRPLRNFLDRQETSRRLAAIGGAGQGTLRIGWRCDRDRAAAVDLTQRELQARGFEFQPVSADRHRPFVGIAGFAIARVVGLELAQQEAAALSHQQPGRRIARENIGGEEARDVEASRRLLQREFLRVEDAIEAVARRIGRAPAAPVAPAVDARIEGRTDCGVGDPRLAQRPRHDVPGRRIVGPELAAQPLATGVALRHDLVSIVAQHQFGPCQHAATQQVQEDGIGGPWKAQKDGAMHAVDRMAARHRLVPIATIDRCRLDAADNYLFFTARLCACRAGSEHRGRDTGAAQEAGACEVT